MRNKKHVCIYFIMFSILIISCSNRKILTIETFPSEANVKLEDNNLGTSTLETKITFRNKTIPLKININKEFYHDTTIMVYYHKQKKYSYNIKLTEIANTFSFNSIPQNSQVLLNNELLGATPFVQKINFPNKFSQGTFCFKNDGYIDTCIYFEYTPGKENILKNVNLLAERIPVNFEKNFNISSLPDYDINNSPIAIWIIRQDSYNVGFIVTGHAEKAICKIASTSVFDLVNKIGDSNKLIASFGIGFDIRPRNSINWSFIYHSEIENFKSKMRELAIRYPQKVVVKDINYYDYEECIDLTEKHIKKIKDSQWEEHIIHYKSFDMPVVLPFRYLKSDSIVTFRVENNAFGSIPYGEARKAIEFDINEAINELKNMLDINSNEITNLKKDFTTTKYFSFWAIKDGKYVLSKYEMLIDDYPEPPKFYTTNEKGNQLETDISVKQAREYLNNPRYIPQPGVREMINNFLEKATPIENRINRKRNECISIISEANQDISSKIDQLNLIAGNIKKLKNEDAILIDAFLRGWPVISEKGDMNYRMKSWYRNYRNSVWNIILSQIPYSVGNNKIGGIFHSDDVFFKVINKEKYYEITPYKVVGKYFIQKLNSNLNVTQYFTPLNFR